MHVLVPMAVASERPQAQKTDITNDPNVQNGQTVTETSPATDVSAVASIGESNLYNGWEMFGGGVDGDSKKSLDSEYIVFSKKYLKDLIYSKKELNDEISKLNEMKNKLKKLIKKKAIEKIKVQTYIHAHNNKHVYVYI